MEGRASLHCRERLRDDLGVGQLLKSNLMAIALLLFIAGYFLLGWVFEMYGGHWLVLVGLFVTATVWMLMRQIEKIEGARERRRVMKQSPDYADDD